MLYDYITELCQVLNIDVPNISHDISKFPTKTTLALCDSDGETIFIKPCNKPNPDCLFAIAHELRHVWQTKTNKALYLGNYKPIDLCSNIEEYNLQLAEIDANAFAGIVMIDMFGLTPLYQGMSQKVKNRINQRIQHIVKNHII